MSDGKGSAPPVSHLIVGVLGLGLIALHFLTYGEMYQELFFEGMSLSSLGNGSTLLANSVIFFSVSVALVFLVVVVFRSFRARAGKSIAPSLWLLSAGFFLPILGILLGWFIGGDA